MPTIFVGSRDLLLVTFILAIMGFGLRLMVQVRLWSNAISE